MRPNGCASVANSSVANFLRVVALVLIAYYGGADKIEGPLHDLTGIALFIVAVLMMLLCDGLISLCARKAIPVRTERGFKWAGPYPKRGERARPAR